MYELLKKLMETAAVSGREQRLADRIEQMLLPYVDSVTRDALGNLIAVKRGSGGDPAKRILLSAHMDEVGFFVTYIEANGMLRVTPVGEIDLVAAAYTVAVSENGVRGVVVREENADKSFSFDKFCLDIGAKDKKDAERRVRVGDFFTVQAGVTRLMHRRICGRPLDDRVGCAILLKLAEQMATVNHREDLYYVFSVQEEVGSRGARTAAASVQPDEAIVFDVTRTGDVPGAKPMATRLGGGVAIKLKDASLITDAGLCEALVTVAKRDRIPYQYEILTTGGSDTSAIQMSGYGCRVTALTVPSRYMHTGAEVIDLNDTEACLKLAVAYLLSKQE